MKTLVIFGPSGVGKSALDELIAPNVLRIEPYRLRPGGPRGENDLLYGHPRLREQLWGVFHGLGLSPSYPAAGIEWFPQARTLFIRVRSEWQLLFLPQESSALAKAEIYAPRFIELLTIPVVRKVFGELVMIILNPTNLSMAKELDIATVSALKKATRQNCRLRGDPEDEADRRAESVEEELPAWQEAIRMGACEVCNWPFPEYRYLGEDRASVLTQARATLLESCPEVGPFLRADQ